jgi:hypothetical protein
MIIILFYKNEKNIYLFSLAAGASGNSGNSILCDSSLKELKKYQMSVSSSRSSLRDEGNFISV